MLLADCHINVRVLVAERAIFSSSRHTRTGSIVGSGFGGLVEVQLDVGDMYAFHPSHLTPTITQEIIDAYQ